MAASFFSKFFRALLILSILLGLLAGGAWWWLKQGINLAGLDLPAVKIEYLSIRLEQKLVIAAERVVLKESRDGPIKTADIDRLVYWTKKALPLAQSIHIDEVASGDMRTSIAFADNTLRLEGTHFSVAASVVYREGSFFCRIHDLVVKSYDARLHGEASLALDTGQVRFSGNFQALGLAGTVELAYRKELFEADFSTEAFSDLAGALKQLPISPEVTSWIEQNIEAKRYQVERFHLRLPINGNTPAFDPNGIEMTAVAHDANITFHPKRAPVRCKTINISWHNDRLAFELSEPRYRNIKLQGSRVHIAPLIGEGSRLHINLKTKTNLDETVLDLLAAYDITLPLYQQSGSTRADLQLDVDLDDFSTRAKGDFTTGIGDWLLGKAPLQTKQATVRLDNNLVRIKNADVHFMDMLQAAVSGAIDTTAKRADLQLDINQLLVSHKGFDLLQAADITTPLIIDYGKKPVTLTLPEYKTNITLAEESTHIDLTDLKAVTPIIPGLRCFSFNQGSAVILSTNWLDYTFHGAIANANDLLSYHNNPVHTFRFHGILGQDGAKLWVNQDRIIAAFNDEPDTPATLQVNVKDYLINYTVAIQDQVNHSLPLPVRIQGEHGLLHVNELDLAVDNFTVDLNGSDTAFTADMEQGAIYLQKTGENMTLAVTELDAKILQPAIDFLDLKEGRLNFKMVGTPENYEGWLEFNNVLLRDYVVLQNVLAFLDTIPSLATFSSPGFDSEGYRVKSGFMHFTMNNKLLTVHSFRTDGETVNSQGDGWADFKKRRLDVDLDLVLMKNLSAIIGMIPLVGYAIQGEDGQLTTSLKITGNMDQPDITTNLAEDIVLAPLNILQRTITWPFRQLEKVIQNGSHPESH